MQLSDLIKSKIDLYGISFGIGSGNLKKAGKHARVQRTMSGSKTKKNVNTKASKTRKVKRVAKVMNKRKLTSKPVKVSKSVNVGKNKTLKGLKAHKGAAKGAKKSTRKSKRPNTSQKHAKALHRLLTSN